MVRAERVDGARVDLHLHSRASGTATNIWVQGLGDGVGVRESYTPPEEAYRTAKRAGMAFVTLTDHETIDGALTLVHHADFFVSEEVSARFPEDGTCVDVLVYGLDAEVHAEAQSRRGDVYGLVDYLREAGVVHALAHPVYDLGGPLDRRGIERRLVLFGLWEFVNGSRPSRQNLLAREIAETVGATELRQMALRHGLPAPPHAEISGIGGSDDHGRAYVAAAWTVAPGVRTKEEFLEALAAGEVYPAGEDGSVGKVTQAAFRLAGAAVEEGEGGQAAGFLRRLSLPEGISRRLRAAAPGPDGKLLRYLPLLARADEATTRSLLTAGYEDRIAKAFKDSGGGFPALDFLGSIGGFMDGHVFIAPYLAVHAYFGRETGKARELRRELWPEAEPEGSPRIAMFVDGLDEIHGVATMYRNIQALDLGDDLRIVGCGVAEAPGVVNVRPISHLRVPLYEGLRLGVPSLLEVLDHVAEGKYDALHVAAPGPLGLAALISGLVLGIPVVGAYHTEFGAYARALSGDAMIAEIVEVAVREFYERCTAVAVSSQAVELALRNRGYRIQSFEVLKNGVDADLFDPAKRDPDLREALGKGRKLLLYAGRLSREKGLERLAAGYSELREHRDDVHLVVAGDGPYREEMQAALGELATFTGFLKGEELARLFASCDVFVFPSTTDTLGRAVIEAQASGLPAVVHDVGGPKECIRPGISGFSVASGEGEFFGRIELLLDDAWLREQMGHAAREFAETLSWQAVMDDLSALHSRLLRPGGRAHATL